MKTIVQALVWTVGTLSIAGICVTSVMVIIGCLRLIWLVVTGP